MQKDRRRGLPRWVPLLLVTAALCFTPTSNGRAKSLELRRIASPGDRSGASRTPPDLSRGALPSGQRFGREFPHLLMATGPRAEKRARSTRVGPGNAIYDPNGPLPPAVLSRARYERLRHTLASSGDPASFDQLKALAASGVVEPDTQRICVLRVDFLGDRPGDRSSGNGRFDLRDSTEASVLLDPPPHDRRYFEKHMEALARYYNVQLNGTVVLQWDVFPAENDSVFHLPDTFPYGPWIFSNSNPDILQHAIDLVGDTLAEADSSDEGIDFSRYQHFLLFHAGPDFQGDVNRDTPWDIPSFNLYVNDPFVVQDSVAINLVMVVPETVSQDDFTGALNGVIAHEFGHQFGFVDLYDVRQGLPVVGAFSLMDSGENLFALVEDPDHPGRNLAVRGTLPASLDPWHKLLWFPEAVQLTDARDVLPADSSQVDIPLDAVELGNEVAYIPVNGEWDVGILSEYFLMENRHLDLNADSTVIIRQDPETGVILGPEPDSTAVGDTLGYREYDWLLPGEGVLVWHIDGIAINAGLNVRGGGVNIFFDRPGIGVVEADGIRDIGTASSEFLGGPFDPYFRGGYDLLGPDTTPSSNSNDGTRTGITIAVLDSIGMRMRVRVGSNLKPPGWPLRLAAEPGDEQVLALDLDGSGRQRLILPAEVPGLGPALIDVGPDGNPDAFVFASLPELPERGLAASETFRGIPGAPEEGAPLVAAVVQGKLQLFNAAGTRLLIWPAAGDGDSSGVTATPVILPDRVLVGCEDGRIRALALDSPGQPVVAEFDVAASPVSALGGDWSDADEAYRTFWAAADGELGAFVWSEQGRVESSWSGTSTVGPERGAPRSPLEVEREDEASYLFSWSDGYLEWWRDREVLPGWPASVGGTLAGDPILADPDQDGELEVFVCDSGGKLHSFGRNGVEDLHWPRSIWSEDMAIADRPESTTGPLAVDVTGDGVPEILIHRADGFLLALDGAGDPVKGWTLSFGTPAVHGPTFIAGGGGVGPRLAVGNLESVTDGRTLEWLSVVQVPGAGTEGRGQFPVRGVDLSRTRVYPAGWVPVPQAVAGNLDEESVRFYPNPLRGDRLTVHFVLGKPAHILLDAYDLSGKRVASLEGPGVPGAAGNQLAWDLSALTPGLYHIRFRAAGDGFNQELFDKVAIVR